MQWQWTKNDKISTSRNCQICYLCSWASRFVSEVGLAELCTSQPAISKDCDHDDDDEDDNVDDKDDDVDDDGDDGADDSADHDGADDCADDDEGDGDDYDSLWWRFHTRTCEYLLWGEMRKM